MEDLVVWFFVFVFVFFKNRERLSLNKPKKETGTETYRATDLKKRGFKEKT